MYIIRCIKCKNDLPINKQTVGIICSTCRTYNYVNSNIIIRKNFLNKNILSRYYL